MTRKNEASTAKEQPDHAGHRTRLRRRLVDSAGAGMPDYEILELVLFGVFRQGDTKPLAKKLLREFGDIAGVLSAEPERLKEIEGCGEAVIAALKATREAGLRLLRARVMERQAVSSWQELLDYCRASMSHQPIEEFRVLFLDRRNRVIADEALQRGTVDHAPVYPREVVKRALEKQASAIIMVHNHPSGDPTPSAGDIEVTRRVQEAAKGVGIALHDHLVMGKDRHVSFKSLGLI